MNTRLYLNSVHRAWLCVSWVFIHTMHGTLTLTKHSSIHLTVPMQVFLSTWNAKLCLSRKESNQALGRNSQHYVFITISNTRYKCPPQGKYNSWLIGTRHAKHSQDAHHRWEDTHIHMQKQYHIHMHITEVHMQGL